MLKPLFTAFGAALTASLGVGVVDVLTTDWSSSKDRASITLLALGLHAALGVVGGALAAGGLLVLGRPASELLGAVLRPLRAHRLRRVADVAVWPVGLGASLLVLAVLSRRFFAFNNPGLAAALLAVLSLAVSLSAARVTRRAAGGLATWLEKGPERQWLTPSAAALAWVGLGIGGGLGLVLRRGAALAETWEALSLGALGSLGVAAACGLLGASAAGWLRRVVMGGGALALVVMGVGLSRGGRLTGDDNAWIHQSGLWAEPAVAMAERLADRDHDGFAAWLGHGDCDDHDPTAFPGSDIGDDCLPDEVLEDRAAFVARLKGGDAPGGAAKRPAPRPLTAPQRPAQRPAPEKPTVSPTPEGPVAAPPPVVTPVEAPPPAPYAVVLITIDTVRADHVGWLGYSRKTTPNLDELAKNSLVFEKAYAPSNMTPISMGALLSGRYTSELVRDDSHFIRFAEENTFLAERLADAGIPTAAVVTHWYFEKKKGSGLYQGFQDWKVVGTQWGKEMESAVTSPLVADEAMRTLDKMPAGRPWLLWAHFLDPHKWYVEHEGFEPRFGNGNKDRYDTEIAFTDHHIGRLLAAVAKRTDADRIAVIVTSDHGEAFGEHGTAFHGFSVYEDQLRVPLIVHAPGLTDGGRRLGKRVSLIDLAPTVMDLVGVPPADDLQGRSWGPELQGEETPARLIYAERVRGPHSAGYRALIDGDWKIVWRAAGNRFELYDLSKDPAELNNLIDSAAEPARRMRSAFASMVEYGLDLQNKVRPAR